MIAEHKSRAVGRFSQNPSPILRAAYQLFMPNFDQWTTPSLTNTTGGQTEPDVVTDELDIDIVPGDPDPSKPFVIFIGSGSPGTMSMSSSSVTTSGSFWPPVVLVSDGVVHWSKFGMLGSASGSSVKGWSALVIAWKGRATCSKTKLHTIESNIPSEPGAATARSPAMTRRLRSMTLRCLAKRKTRHLDAPGSGHRF